VLDDLQRYADLALRQADDCLLLIGETRGHLGQTVYLRQLLQRRDGPPPPMDLAVERRNGDFVRGLIAAATVDTCHDLSDGGLLVAAAEMAMAGNIGLDMDGPDDPGFWFGEDQGRYLLAVPEAVAGDILQKAEKLHIPARMVGRTGGETLTLNGGGPISLSRLRRSHEAWLPDYMQNA
ncbi:MAG: AIR synthase-related protein, partial [Alphaproteobacteria bacterium]|nr:AIR synthase-related protein [Alphaproteobacteria bacterium]